MSDSPTWMSAWRRTCWRPPPSGTSCAASCAAWRSTIARCTTASCSAGERRPVRTHRLSPAPRRDQTPRIPPFQSTGPAMCGMGGSGSRPGPLRPRPAPGPRERRQPPSRSRSGRRPAPCPPLRCQLPWRSCSPAPATAHASSVPCAGGRASPPSSASPSAAAWAPAQAAAGTGRCATAAACVAMRWTLRWTRWTQRRSWAKSPCWGWTRGTGARSWRQPSPPAAWAASSSAATRGQTRPPPCRNTYPLPPPPPFRRDALSLHSMLMPGGP